MKFKVGDRVYCKRYKKHGIIRKIDLNSLSEYPIIVELKGRESKELYTIDGRWALYEEKIVLTHCIEMKIKKILKF